MFELAKFANGKQALELHRLRIKHEKLFATYNTVLPKVNPALIADLLEREIDYHSDCKNARMYTVEVFTKKEIDSEEAKKHVIQKKRVGYHLHMITVRRRRK
jgi:hypothetical protein